tara:strand:+ start:727 stop:1854 length:1128 start_codon:yes stop_codon:yes gene_type:complete
MTSMPPLVREPSFNARASRPRVTRDRTPTQAAPRRSHPLSRPSRKTVAVSLSRVDRVVVAAVRTPRALSAASIHLFFPPRASAEAPHHDTMASVASARATKALALSSRARVSGPTTRALAPASTSATRPRARRAGGLDVRADGGSGIDFRGFPYVIARKAGFDTSEGIAGFTPFAELFIGRTAMGGFATGCIQELLTGDGILAQLGLVQEGVPNEFLFQFFIAFLLGSSFTGCFVTFKQFAANEVSDKQRRRYQRFFGLDASTERARAEAERAGKDAADEGAHLATEFSATLAAAGDQIDPSMATIDESDDTMTPKETEAVNMAYLKKVELNNARWAMVGFFAAVLIEARTGAGVKDQLIMYAKMTGVLGPDSGF